MDFNINQHVQVRLTDLGRDIHRRRHEAIRARWSHVRAYKPPKEDAEGWSTWQLWSLMNIFGSYCDLCAEPPFETDIRLLENS